MWVLVVAVEVRRACVAGWGRGFGLSWRRRWGWSGLGDLGGCGFGLGDGGDGGAGRLGRWRCGCRLGGFAASRAAGASGAERDLDALVLACDGFRVDVVDAVVVDGAGVECGVALVCDAAIGANGESGRGRSTHIALELGGGWCQDAASSVGISEAAIAEAVASIGQVVTNAVLAVTELAKDALSATRCLELEALCVSASNEGIGTKAECEGSECVSHINDCVGLLYY